MFNRIFGKNKKKQQYKPVTDEKVNDKQISKAVSRWAKKKGVEKDLEALNIDKNFAQKIEHLKKDNPEAFQAIIKDALKTTKIGKKLQDENLDQNT